MSDFRAFLESLGLTPGVVAPDGKWRRCRTTDKPRKRNGSYKLTEDGRIGFAVNWATMSDVAIWRASADAVVPEFDAARLDRARSEARRKLIKATQAARDFYESCKPLVGGHPYLNAHDLDMTGCYGLRVDADGWLVVPALRDGKVSTVQRISPDGEKRFWPGASVKGASYTIDRVIASITILCEGLATGLALYAAVRQSRILVAFNAGNMLAVAPKIPTGLAVVAADNDWQTEARIGSNPGVLAAQKAAEAIGCGLAVPEGIEGSDWSDLRSEMVRARMEAKKPRERESNIRRAVDVLIATEIGRAARFVVKR